MDPWSGLWKLRGMSLWNHRWLGNLATSWLGEPGYINGLGNLATSWHGEPGYILAWGTWLHLGLEKLATSKAVWHRPPAEPSAVRTTGLTLTWFQLVYKRATLCVSNTRSCPCHYYLKRQSRLFYCIWQMPFVHLGKLGFRSNQLLLVTLHSCDVFLKSNFCKL